MKISISFALVPALLFLAACEKGPGEGGNSSIRGNVWVKDINSTFQVQAQYDGFDEDVYIIYGDDVSHSDRIRTNYDGKFEFKYLRPGKYRIYVYSDDSVAPLNSPGTVSVIKEIEITEKKQSVEAGQFTIYK